MSVDHDNRLSGVVIGAAIDVHRELGPGAKEPACERALSLRLSTLGIAHQCQLPLPLQYKGATLDCGYRLDVVAEARLPLELKAVETILGVHEAQLLTQLRLGRFELGLLINFEVPRLKDGIRRRVLSQRREIDSCRSSYFVHPPDPLSRELLDAAFEIHRYLGRGLLRSAYEECLCYELTMRGISFTREHQIPLIFGGVDLSQMTEVPLLIQDNLPVYCLSVSQIKALHEARLQARLRQGEWPFGLIINFNAYSLKDGIRRLALR